MNDDSCPVDEVRYAILEECKRDPRPIVGIRMSDEFKQEFEDDIRKSSLLTPTVQTGITDEDIKRSYSTFYGYPFYYGLGTDRFAFDH